MNIIILLISVLITVSQCEVSTTQRPQWGYNNNKIVDSSKSRQPLRTLKIQIRNGAQLPPGFVLRPNNMKQRVVQRVPIKIVPLTPMKIKINGAALMVKKPLMGQQQLINKGNMKHGNQHRPFQSSASGPHTGEYVFENPFANFNSNSFNKQPIENTISLTTSENNGPIHTIPAPNLSLVSGQYRPQNNFNFQHDNHLSLTDSNAFAYHHSTLKPNQIGQYQVTEETTNDHTIQNPFSGSQSYYAPDPDPSLHTLGIQPTTDPFSRPSNNQQLPKDVATSASLAQQQFFQYVNPIAQQQLPDTYGLPLNNQPQLQQHLQQQAQFMTQMPLSPYNPTYLVQQSNNLYNQHQQQQLFKPEANYLSIYNNQQFSQDSDQSQRHEIETVVSPGQIYESSKFQNQLPNIQQQYQTIAESNHFGIGASAEQQYQNNNNQNQLSNPQIEPFTNNQLNDPYQAQGSQTINTYSNFIDSSSTKKPFYKQQQQYVNSQQENEQILSKSTQELYEILNQQQQLFSTISPTESAHVQHQQLLTQQFGEGGLQPMRIVLPDDDQYTDSSNNYQFNQRPDENTTYENDSTENNSPTITDEPKSTETDNNFKTSTESGEELLISSKEINSNQ